MSDQIAINRFVNFDEKIKQTVSLQRVKNILAMYDGLRERGGVNKDAFCKQHKISARTFTRYLSIVNMYLEDDGEDIIVVNEYDNYEIM